MKDKARFWHDLKTGRFASMVKESSKGQSVSNSQEVFNIVRPLIAQEEDIERVFVIFLDAQNKVLAIENLFSGTITASTIYTRELVKRLIQLKASAFILTHNHPSGHVTPSKEDKNVTIKIGIAAAAIDVQMHDHIIIGDGYYSMADTGWLKNVSSRYSDLFKG